MQVPGVSINARNYVCEKLALTVLIRSVTMKKTNKPAQRLLLSVETVRKLQPLDERQLRGVAGGRIMDTTDDTTACPACPQSVVPHPK